MKALFAARVRAAEIELEYEKIKLHLFEFFSASTLTETQAAALANLLAFGWAADQKGVSRFERWHLLNLAARTNALLLELSEIKKTHPDHAF